MSPNCTTWQYGDKKRTSLCYYVTLSLPSGNHMGSTRAYWELQFFLSNCPNSISSLHNVNEYLWKNMTKLFYKCLARSVSTNIVVAAWKHYASVDSIGQPRIAVTAMQPLSQAPVRKLQFLTRLLVLFLRMTYSATKGVTLVKKPQQGLWVPST